MRRRKLPGIEALTAFEAAARHQSFTRAADELALTQSAVGRQILLLEEYLGVRLFNRIKRRVSLTETGEIYAREIREDLNRIEKHTLAAMATRQTGGALQIAVIPTLATHWLIPRLPKFCVGHRDITVNLTTCAEPLPLADMPWDTIDAAIHVGTSLQPRMVMDYLFGEEMITVCSPNLWTRATPLPPRAMPNFTLLHSTARPDAWHQWLSQAGIRAADVRGPRYELFSMLVEAARAGLGIALVPRILVTDELTQGVLVVPSDLSLHTEKGYYFMHPECKQGSPGLQAFKHWLLHEAAQHRDPRATGT